MGLQDRVSLVLALAPWSNTRHAKPSAGRQRRDVSQPAMCTSSVPYHSFGCHLSFCTRVQHAWGRNGKACARAHTLHGMACSTEVLATKALHLIPKRHMCNKCRPTMCVLDMSGTGPYHSYMHARSLQVLRHDSIQHPAAAASLPLPSCHQTLLARLYHPRHLPGLHTAFHSAAGLSAGKQCNLRPAHTNHP
jgi:hypothetical protein